MKHETWVAIDESKLESQKMIIFLTREFRMRNTSYRELWENVSLARWAVKHYANEIRSRLTLKSLFICI